MTLRIPLDSAESRDLYPPWQGMQYLHNMFSGRAKLEPLDNDRYPRGRWIMARDVLAAYQTHHRGRH